MHVVFSSWRRGARLELSVNFESFELEYRVFYPTYPPRAPDEQAGAE